MRFRRVLPAPSLRIVVVGLVALAVVLAACGDDGEAGVDDVVTGDSGDGNGQEEGTATQGDGSGSADPEETDATEPGSDGPNPDWERIEATDELVSPNVITPDELVVDPDDPNGVLVRFFGGVQECHGARATVTEETEEMVRIRLETGGRPGAEDQMCITIAVTLELKVSLDGPVGDRDLVAVGV